MRIIGDDQECPPLVRDIIRMGSNLGMSTIAEGVETPRQVDLLRRHGCGEGQGYYFSRPMDSSTTQKAIEETVHQPTDVGPPVPAL